jgi:hypothetical protein
MTTRKIGKQPDEIGGDYATTELPEDYIGPVALIAAKRNDPGKRTLAVFPTLSQACIAASYAVSPDGGYSEVELVEAGEQVVTHDDWQDWAFE